MDNKRKNIILVSSIILLILIISGLTYAWYTWSTSSDEETKIVTNFGSATVFYDAGSDITGISLRPTGTKEEGIVKTITIRKDRETEYDLTFNLYLDILALPNALKDASFKYELYKVGEDDALQTGTFNNLALVECQTNSTEETPVSHIELVMNDLVTTSGSTYMLYIWIDGNMTNPNTMQNQTFNFKLHAEGSNAVLGEILVQHINKLYSNADKSVVSNGEEGSKINYNYASSVSLMNDRLGGVTTSLDAGNIRYYGASPNNYIDIGDVYDNDIVVGNWVELLKKFGTPDWLMPENSAECLEYLKCSNLVSIGFFSSNDECEIILPTLISQEGYNTTEEICIQKTIPKGTTKSLYRIIGLFKDVKLSDGRTKDLIKVVREESIGGHIWDTSSSDVNGGYGINEWSQADLMKLLNPTYETNTGELCTYDEDTGRGVCDGTTGLVNNSLWWNSGSGHCYTLVGNVADTCDYTNYGLSLNVHNKIEEVVWNTGGHDVSTLYPNQIYGFERGVNVVIPGTTCSGDWCNDAITRKTDWKGKVALMYPSDYSYAVDFNSCNENLRYYNNSTCTENNWIYNSNFHQWLLTSASSTASGGWHILEDGKVYSSNSVCSTGNVYPVFYLDSSLGIVSGDGSKDKPYVVR